MFIRLRQKLQSHEAREILHHGLIGGLVAVILIGVEVSQRVVLKNWSEAHPFWFAVAVVIVAFIIGFTFLALFERYIRLKIPIRIDAIEDVADGIWAYKTKDVLGDKWNRTSMAEITSSGWGFHLTGTSYSREDLRMCTLSSSSFRGQATLWDDDKISFRYRGFEMGDKATHEKPNDAGVGYYQFYRAGKHLCIRGTFTGLLGPGGTLATRRLQGIRVSREINETTRDQAKQVMSELLDDEPADTGFAGTWLDAIYQKHSDAPQSEKWELIQGSIIEIIPHEIDSSAFTIDGRSFDVQDISDWQNGDRIKQFPFKGQGRVVTAQFPVLYYVFKGFEDKGGEGVTRYELQQVQGGDHTFVGEFTGGQREPLRIVFGKKIQEQNAAKRMELLREYMQDCRKKPPARFLHASSTPIPAA